MQIYAGEFEKAQADLEQSSGIMHANKVLYEKNQFPDFDEEIDAGDAPADNASNASS